MKRISYRSATDNFSRTSVENIFINKFMPTANGDYVKVYLYGLKNSQFPDQMPMDNAELARFLCIDESTIRLAYEYWSNKGIIEIVGSGEDVTVLFLDISSKFGSEKELKTNPDTFVSRYKNDEMYKELIKKAENMLGGQVLPFNFIKTLNTWIEEYNFNYECICYLMEYCLTTMDLDTYQTINGKMNYLNKVAQSWYENHVVSVQDAIFYVQEYKAHTKLLDRIFKELGIHRSPMRFERDLCEKWVNNFHFGRDIIMEGVKRTRKPNLSYLDKILTNWSINNVKTVDDIALLPQKSYTKKKTNSKEMPVSEDSIKAAKTIEYSIIDRIRKKQNYPES